MKDWYPGAYVPDPEYPPHYTTMPAYLRIEDAVRPKFPVGSRRERFWTRSRDAAFAEWAGVGIKFHLTETTEPYKDNRVSLVLSATLVPPTVPAWHCFECNECEDIDGCDWIQVNRLKFLQFFIARNQKQMTYLIAHEFGHSLGFGHGGDGIMSEDPHAAKVNAEEIAAAKAYWGTT